MKKNIYLLGIILFIVVGCKQNEVIKTHGIAYLKKRESAVLESVASNPGNTLRAFNSEPNINDPPE